jgi:hypothetical protein
MKDRSEIVKQYNDIHFIGFRGRPFISRRRMDRERFLLKLKYSKSVLTISIAVCIALLIGLQHFSYLESKGYSRDQMLVSRNL